LAKEKILIVEDEYLVAHDISNMLVELGYTVVNIVSTAEAAIAGVRETRPDLVLLDIVLKGSVDGITAATLIKEESAIPVIFLTAHADEMTLSRAKIADPLGYLLKPFELRELKTAVELALYKNAHKHDASPWAVHDLQSGLPNKISFLDHLKKSIFLAERRSRSIAVLAFVFAEAKPPEDDSSAGPEDFISVIAEKFTSSLRKSDTVTRLESGEFLVLLPDLDNDKQALSAFHRICGLFQEPLSNGLRRIPLHVTSSIALLSKDDQDPEILIKKALDGLLSANSDDKG